MVGKMREASNLFYRMAQCAGCHTFIEFCGLMNKYIDVCSRAAQEGVDFTLTSVHAGKPLPVEGHDVAYLAEKFACIFAASMFRDPKMWKAFQQAVERELQP